jgi:hypothetical protein
MRSDKDDRNFPAIRLADTANIDSPTELHRRKLKELAGRIGELHSFTTGQFVKWKAGLKNRKFPDYGEPAIRRSKWERPYGCRPIEGGASFR